MKPENQPELFHDSIDESLRDLVMALGGYKAVGARMRPEMAADQAGRWLADCLNEARREHLTPPQVMWLLREGRERGHHQAMAWIAGDAGYSNPQPVEPEDERARLQREYIEATRMLGEIADRIDRLQAAPVSRVAR